ncbi:LrgB family protein [Pseudoflavonifractor sp. AF19-9AC]|uniref:LrgB family protein n=1 Tax=Pseudoflavonifractor sp. AF19-9AC TaxID=2292244 RepID=UPI000E4730DF|nr:LrgB family protein [Pseudoflavonifractor sp. AF19-9AC]RHR06110.1 LrgB family protein [Pseudoflavonifractor sp. AF19-9AC]
MAEAMLSSPFFGLVLTCVAWCIGCWVQKRTGIFLLNPLVIAVAIILAVLVALDIPYSTYQLGGDMISLMLGPVTAVLALNIYHQRTLLREYFWPVVIGCLAGTLTSVGSILLLCRLLVLDSSIAASLMPKSVTTAIAVAISDAGGGIQSITVAAVLIAGAVGAIFAPLFAKLFRVTDPVAEGVAIGACSHALGTSKAMEIGQLQGAMSSISICICGILTSLLALFL